MWEHIVGHNIYAFSPSCHHDSGSSTEKFESNNSREPVNQYCLVAAFVCINNPLHQSHASSPAITLDKRVHDLSSSSSQSVDLEAWEPQQSCQIRSITRGLPILTLTRLRGHQFPFLARQQKRSGGSTALYTAGNRRHRTLTQASFGLEEVTEE